MVFIILQLTPQDILSQLFKKEKGVNIAYISESLGHTSLNTTQSYLDSFETEERQKNAKLLTEL